MTKPAPRRRVEPALDQLPRLEIVGERDRAEIVAERRADARGDRQHRGDAGHDREVERAPGFAARLRSPRRPPPPWRTRRDRRRRRPRRCAPCAAWRSAARGARALPRGCRRHGALWPGARRHAVEIGAVAVERLGASASAAAASGVSQRASPGPRPTTASRPLTAGPPSRAPARRRNRAPSSSGLAASGIDHARRPWCRARHRSRAASRPAAVERAPHLGRLRPTFMTTAASASARRRASSASGSVPGSTVSTSSPCAIGMPAADQQPDMPVTPAMTSVG